MRQLTWIIVAWSMAGLGSPLRAQLPADSGERARAIHVLHRLAYGPRPAEVDRVVAMGVEAYIAQQLDPARIDDGVLEARLADFVVLQTDTRTLAALLRGAQDERREQQRQQPDTGDASRRPVRTPPGANARTLRRRLGEFQAVAVVRAVVSERQLHEVMVDFWTNHFNVFLGKGPERALMPGYIERTIRPRALGRFEDLLIATAQSPAMLVYLDNAQSVQPGATPPRLERMRARLSQPRMGGRRPGGRGAEMRTRADSMLRRLEDRVPKGLNENYARELLELHTLGVDGGYTQDDVQGVARILTGWSVGDPFRSPEFVFNDWAHDRTAKTALGVAFPAGGGMEEGLELLRMLASHPSTARHMSRKLCARFVSDDPPPGCVDTAAAAWERSDGAIREVLAAIFRAPEFWPPEYRDVKVKTPLEFVASAVRAVGGTPDASPALARVVAHLGQPLYLEPAPTGYPESQESWVNASALLERLNIAMALGGQRLPGVSVALDPVIPRLDDPAALAAAVNTAVLAGRGSPSTLRVIAERVAAVRDAARAHALAIGLALGSPEFQRQ